LPDNLPGVLVQGVKATYINLDSVLTRTEKYPDLFGTLRKRIYELVGAESEKSVPVVTGMMAGFSQQSLPAELLRNSR
jgi:hypothetical protein